MNRKKILVPLDFSIQSDLTLEYAERFAAKLNAMISFIYVVEEQNFLGEKNSTGETKHRLRREAENRLSEKVNSVLDKEKNIPFELIITSGKVYQKVQEKSSDLNAQIIVMGRSNTAHRKATKTGSNTKRIVANSQVPVLSITDQRIANPRHLIIPIDLETPFKEQINWALGTALLLEASVSIIAVVEKESASHRPVYLKLLQKSECLFTEKGIKCETHLLEKQTTISREILSFSAKSEFGIILIMTRHEKKSGGPGLGSNASELLARTDLPVLFIPPNYPQHFAVEDYHMYHQQ